MILDPFFRWLADQQERRTLAVALSAVILTVFFAFGVFYIRIETDFTKELPQDNPAFVLNNRVRDTFSGQDAIFVLVQVDPSSQSKKAVKDIRDPRVIQMLMDLEDEAVGKSGVDKAQSVVALFRRGSIPGTLDGVKGRLDATPGASQFYNRDYSATTLSVLANVGSSPDKVNSLTEDILESISEVPKPPGVKLTITGMPPIRARIGQILVNDAKYTIALASLIILLLLLVMTKPFIRGFLVFSPLVMALIWTLGTMGWLDIPLSMVTVGVGAMILGLGVEYSAFYVSVYDANRKRGESQNDALYTSLREVGAAIFGSASTTVVGFLALLLASMPLMHHLGFTLALGITYCFITALVFNPALIVLEENNSPRILRFIARMAGHKEVGEE
ncbi:MAG: MMPL family transporter [Candidatus Altiarchaeota archaeon]